MGLLPVAFVVLISTGAFALPKPQGYGQDQGYGGGGGGGGMGDLSVHEKDANGNPISRFLKPQLYQQNEQTVNTQVSQVQEMKQEFNQRWTTQNQDWQKLQESQAALQQRISQKGGQQMLQQFQSQQSSYQQNEQSFVQQKQQLQGTIQNIEQQFQQLKQKNQQLLQQVEQNPTSIDPAQAKRLLSEFRTKQQQLAQELPGALNQAAQIEQGHADLRKQVNKWQEGYQNNPVLAGGGGDNNWDQWLNADYWEKHHEEMWGQFEQFFGKWQNWANDPNAGNYKLANKRWGAFDNGEFNIEKTSEEFFGPDHVANDELHGNYTNNSGFGAGGAGAGGYGSDGQGGQGGAGGYGAGGVGGQGQGGAGGAALTGVGGLDCEHGIGGVQPDDPAGVRAWQLTRAGCDFDATLKRFNDRKAAKQARKHVDGGPDVNIRP